MDGEEPGEVDFEILEINRTCLNSSQYADSVLFGCFATTSHRTLALASEDTIDRSLSVYCAAARLSRLANTLSDNAISRLARF